ncbi:MAG: GAF domain-containing protein, partial [Cyanobacteria bacterium P01_G01_bin.49]
MTLPTPSSSNQNSENSQIKQNLNQSEPQKVSLLGRNEPPLKSRKQVSKGGTWSFSSKAMIGAIAVSTIPVLAVGILTYSMVRSLRQQVIQTGQSEGPVLAETENNFDRQLGLLLLGTAVTAGLAGAIAIFMTRRTVNPVLQGTAMTNKLVDQLRRQEANTFNSQARPDDLGSLQSNLSIIEERLPELIWKQEAETERYQILMDIIQQMRKARSEEEVLRLAVTGIRQAFQTDRIGIFRFNTSSWEGSFVEESVAPGFPKALWSTIKDPCFEGHAQEYAQGRIHAIDNIYEAELGDCYITLLERFAVKANLVAPIMQDDQLFGLLIGHQCTGPRLWQQHEIDLFAQLATQVGLALERARLLEQFDMKATRSQVFIEITHNIRASLIEEDILEATVYQVRKELWCDRVIVYHFSEDWYGTVVAESVLPGCPKALYAKIKDPCFEEGYVEQYKAGRVQAINNVHEAGLTECHLKQLEPFGVKASLIAPIVKDNHLFGLLIAHECAAPRNWQPWEIDLFTQIA